MKLGQKRKRKVTASNTASTANSATIVSPQPKAKKSKPTAITITKKETK